MSSAILSLRAQRDLVAAARSIARDSPSAASRFPGLVLSLAKKLGDFPDLGAERPEIAAAPYRFASIPGFPHLVAYNARRRPPVIMRLVHGARDLPSVLRNLPRDDETKGRP
jgi:toxin ParE1/3/4